MAIPNEPLSRLEQYLNKIATENGTIPEAPLTRIEMYLNRIATGSGNVPETPHTRLEMYLNKIATESGNVPEEPYTRAEMYLNKIATGDGNTPEEALTRIEMYLAEIAKGGGGGELVENFNRIGDPLIEDGILTSSSGGWIATPTDFNGANPWMLTTKIYRPRLLGAYENFLMSDGFKLQTLWQSSAVVPYFYDADGTNIFPNGGLSKSVDSEAWTWLKVGWNGERYDIGVSTDGTNYLWAGNATEPFGSTYSRPSTTPIKSGILQIGTSNTAAQFDLNETKIEINGEIWWTPYVRG